MGRYDQGLCVGGRGIEGDALWRRRADRLSPTVAQQPM